MGSRIRIRFLGIVAACALLAACDKPAAPGTAERSQADALTQFVAVYVALGGGWVDLAAQQAPKPPGASSAAE